jgi:hypothetical protein
MLDHVLTVPGMALTESTERESECARRLNRIEFIRNRAAAANWATWMPVDEILVQLGGDPGDAYDRLARAIARGDFGKKVRLLDPGPGGRWGRLLPDERKLLLPTQDDVLRYLLGLCWVPTRLARPFRRAWTPGPTGLDLNDSSPAEAAGLPPVVTAAPRPVPAAALERWYRTYVAGWLPRAPEHPSLDGDWAAAKTQFPEHKVARARVAELRRRDYAPKEWSAPGRRPKAN